jgi:hypothetical protein
MEQTNSRRHRINGSILSAMRNVFAANLLGIVLNLSAMNILSGCARRRENLYFAGRRCGYAE